MQIIYQMINDLGVPTLPVLALEYLVTDLQLELDQLGIDG